VTALAQTTTGTTTGQSAPAVNIAQNASATQNVSTALPTAPNPGPARDSSSAAPSSLPADSVASNRSAALPEVSHTQKYIEPGQIAPRITPGDKILLGLRDSVSPLSALGWVATSGYEQILNGSPNYGTDWGAYGQRLGAATIRDATEGVFSDSVMSPLMHEDPRYYRMGPSHNFFVRLVYSGTRPIFTRTDGGRTSPNFALLAGTLAGSALTNTYYPQLNRGPTQTLETFGGSLGGSAVGYVVSEFTADLLHLFHHGQQ
jgi:hypothetical protein